MNGKQHGLGLYTNEVKEKMWGIWINGKRTRWLEEKDLEEIKNDDCYKEIINFNK